MVLASVGLKCFGFRWTATLTPKGLSEVLALVELWFLLWLRCGFVLRLDCGLGFGWTAGLASVGQWF